MLLWTSFGEIHIAQSTASNKHNQVIDTWQHLNLNPCSYSKVLESIPSSFKFQCLKLMPSSFKKILFGGIERWLSRYLPLLLQRIQIQINNKWVFIKEQPYRKIQRTTRVLLWPSYQIGWPIRKTEERIGTSQASLLLRSAWSHTERGVATITFFTDQMPTAHNCL